VTNAIRFVGPMSFAHGCQNPVTNAIPLVVGVTFANCVHYLTRYANGLRGEMRCALRLNSIVRHADLRHVQHYRDCQHRVRSCRASQSTRERLDPLGL
jgi:hypothetical protein